ncbi:MAG: hypothetical protein H7Y43_16145 [Akkermansiaceae bacterium]|nr:hypothetical protein [Verrucomicrobiales bacterium]
MKTPITPLLITVLTWAVAGSAADLKPARETSFAEVTRQLDSGGSVYGYLATDQWLAGLSTNVAQFSEFFASLPEVPAADRQKIQRAIGLAAHAIQKSGLETLTGIGVSGIQITPELHRTKFIMHHPKGQGDGVFWNVTGNTPHALEGLNLLTTNTALAAFGDLDVPMLWNAIAEEIRHAQIPELTQALEEWPQKFEQGTKISWSRFLASLGGEIGLVLTLDESRKITLPLGQPVEMPEPGLLIAIKVKDDLLYERVSSELKKNSQAQITDESGLKMASMRLPLPLPMELHITAASSGGYLFLATSPGVVRNALEVRAGKQDGLTKSAAFAGLMKYLPAEGNQFFYADRRFSGTIQAIQKEFLAREDAKILQSGLVQKYLFNKPPAFGLSISRRTATGWETVSVGNQDSATALVAAPVVGAGAMMAAMVLPALAKAKDRAQSISCINNMKQIGLAFRIWSSDNEDRFPFHVSKDKGGTLELVELNNGGYDLASYRHFQVMSNELNAPRILVCPEDSSKKAASDFGKLQPENVSYLIRSGKDVVETDPQSILIYCPIHHHVGRTDGSVGAGKKND